MLPQQRITRVLDVEEMGPDEPVEDEDVLASITAGMANITMNDVTTWAHTKIGIRFSVIPGARSLSVVVISETATASEPTSVNVISCAQTSGRLLGV